MSKLSSAHFSHITAWMTHSSCLQIFMINFSDHADLPACSCDHHLDRSGSKIQQKYSWRFIIRANKSQPLLPTDLFTLSDVHPPGEWLIVSSLFKGSRVRPEAVTRGQRSVRPSVDTCQQQNDAARLGSIAGLDYWNNTNAPERRQSGGVHRLQAHTNTSKRASINLPCILQSSKQDYQHKVNLSVHGLNI